MASKKLQDLYYTLELRDKQFLKETKKVQNQLKGMESKTKSSTKNMGKSFTGMGAKLAKIGVVVAGVAVALKKAFDLSKIGAKFNQSVDALESQFGLSADKVLTKLREVSGGTIADTELILATNKAMALGVTDNVEDLAKLLEFARLRGKAMGLDTTQAFSDLVTGIGRGSPLILDNLGIVTKAWSKEAQATGQAMDATFLMEKVLATASVELEKVGGNVLSDAEKFEQLKTEALNLKLGLGQLALKGMSPVVEGLASGFKWAVNLISKYKGLKNATDMLKSAMVNYGNIVNQLNDSKKALNKTEIISLRLAQSQALNQINEAMEQIIKSELKYQKITGTGRSRLNQLRQDSANLQFQLELQNRQIASGRLLNAQELRVYNNRLKQLAKMRTEILQYNSSIESFVQSSAEGIRQGLFTIEKFAVLGSGITDRILEAVNNPVIVSEAYDVGGRTGQAFVDGVADTITSESPVIKMRGERVSGDGDISAGFIERGMQNTGDSVSRVREEAIDLNSVFEKTLKIVDSIDDVVGVELKGSTKGLTEGMKKVADQLPGIAGLVANIVVGLFTLGIAISEAIQGSDDFWSAWKAIRIEIEKSNNDLAIFNDRLAFAEKIGDETNKILVDRQKVLLDTLKLSDDLADGLISESTLDRLRNMHNMYLDIKDDLIDINALASAGFETETFGLFGGNTRIAEKDMQGFSDYIKGLLKQGVIDADQYNEAFNAMIGFGDGAGIDEVMTGLDSALQTAIDSNQVLIDGSLEMLDNNEALLDLMKDQTGEMDKQADLQKSNVIQQIRDMINLGLLDPENVRDIQRITGMLGGAGITGQDALLKLGSLGVSGMDFQRGINVGSMTNIYQGVSDEDMAEQINSQTSIY